MDAKGTRLFPEFAKRCEEARAALRGHMSERGMHERDGWRIHESTREREGRTEIVMRPVHLHLPAPTDLECMCTIDEPGSEVSADCQT